MARNVVKKHRRQVDDPRTVGVEVQIWWKAIGGEIVEAQHAPSTSCINWAATMVLVMLSIAS